MYGTRICQRTFEIVSKEVLWSVRGSYQTIWGPPLPNVTRHSGWWPHKVTPSIHKTLHQFLTVTDLDLITEFDFLPNCARFPYYTCNGCGMPTEDAYASGHLVLSHFGTCICSNVETNLSWTCLVSGLLIFEYPSVLRFCLQLLERHKKYIIFIILIIRPVYPYLVLPDVLVCFRNENTKLMHSVNQVWRATLPKVIVKADKRLFIWCLFLIYPTKHNFAKVFFFLSNVKCVNT